MCNISDAVAFVHTSDASMSGWTACCACVCKHATQRSTNHISAVCGTGKTLTDVKVQWVPFKITPVCKAAGM